MRAAGYVRVSTDDQAERGLSLGEQRRQISDYIGVQGWEPLEIYEDKGYSGARADRPGLVRLLAERANFDVLVLWSLDRLGRDLTLLATTVGKLREAGVQIESLNGSIELETAEGELHFHIGAAVSQYERQLIARRGRMAADAIAHQGRYNGPRPLGYRFEDGLLVPVAKEALIVRRIFTEFISGRGYSQVARDLNAQHVSTVRDGNWRSTTIRGMLTNPVYVGRVRLRGEERQGVHEPIIDLETWNKVQALLAAQFTPKGKGRGRKPRGQHLFIRGLLRCADCGEAIVPRTQGDSYLCNGRQVHGCEMPWVSRKDIDQAVYAYFEQVALDVEATRRTLAEARDRKLAEVRQLLSEANAEQRRSEERFSRVRRDYQDGRLDADDWRQQRGELAAELDAANAEMERLRNQEQDVAQWAEFVDAEQATLERLTEIRRVIAGELQGSDAIESVRAVLARTFERFVLHRAASSRAPKRLHVELAMIDGFVIEPVVREQVIRGYSESMRPVLQREPLAPNKERQGVGYRLIDG